MNQNFQEDYPTVKLSKYFIDFIEDECNALGLLLYYSPDNNRFIVSDKVLGDLYKTYRTTQQIRLDSLLDNPFLRRYHWYENTIVLFNKEEIIDDNFGSFESPQYYEYNHEISFELDVPNFQKLLISIFKDPLLQSECRKVQTIFSITDLNIFFPSETIKTEDEIDFLLIKSLDSKHLLYSLCNHHLNINFILREKSEEYLVNFFNLFKGLNDLDFKHIIFAVTKDEQTRSKIFETLPKLKKFLKANVPDNFLSQITEELPVFKTYFSLKNLGVRYHLKFHQEEVKKLLLDILQDQQIIEEFSKRKIYIQSAFYNAERESIVSIIQNESPLKFFKIEQFFCNSLDYIENTDEQNLLDNKNNRENIFKFFNYFYLNELSLEGGRAYTKAKPTKI